MKLNLKLFLSCCFSLLSLQLLAQAEPSPFSEEFKPLKKEYYIFSPRISITVPQPVSNSSFKKSFVGVYECSGGLNVMFFKGLFAGITYKNGYLKIMENKIPDYNAGMTINNVGLKVGGDKYLGEKNRMIYSASVSAGKNWTRFSSLVCKDPANDPPMVTNYTTTYIEPEMNWFFLVEQNFGIGVTVSYTIFNRNFDAYELCLDDWAAFNKNNPGATQYFSFGFGFYYSFFKKKR